MYSTEQLELLTDYLSKCPVTGDALNSYTGKVSTVRFDINKVYFSDEDRALFVNLSGSNGRTRTLKLRHLLQQLGQAYKTRSKFLLDLKEYVDKSSEKFGNTVRKFLNEGIVVSDLDSVNINTDEIEWLSKHVRKIRALVPTKMLYIFNKNFPDQICESRDNQWSFGFTLFFDEVEDIPNTLLTLKNKNGNTIDLDKKSFSNTSYIWKLVKTYPDMFSFGKR